MTARRDDASDLVADLLQAAVRSDGKGYLNVSKMLRASAAAVAQRAAAERGFPDDPRRLAGDLLSLAERLKGNGIDAGISDRVALGAELVAGGTPAYRDRFPDPYVCRRCGTIADGVPASSCARCGAHALTFERFGPVYWMTEYRPHEVVDRLAANPALFREALDALGSDRSGWRPHGTAWAAVDVLRHIRAADALLAQRIDLILDEDEPPLAFKAVYALKHRDEEQAETVESIMADYRASRTASVSRLVAIRPDDWRRAGIHQELGRVTLIAQASYFAAHELTHLRQLELLRRAVALERGDANHSTG